MTSTIYRCTDPLAGHKQHSNGQCHACRSRINRQTARQRIIEHYGGQCVCCGESCEAFLVLDHIDGDGNMHRRSLAGVKDGSRQGTGYKTYRDVIARGFPEGFQLLCANCNMAKHRFGQCPHQESQ